MLLLAPLVACQPDPVPVPVDPCTSCAVTDENNYSISATLDIASVALTERSDSTVSWAGLTTNIRGETIDPYTAIGDAWLVGFDNLTPEEVESTLATDTLNMSALTLTVNCSPTDAECLFSEFGLAGNYLNPQEYFIEGRATWLVVLSTGGLSGVQAFTFVEARADSTETRAEIGDTSTALGVDLDLQTLEPLFVAPGPDIVVEWSGLTTDGLGNPLSLHKLDRLMLGRYDASLAEMEDRVWELETGATELWEADLEASSIALADLAGDTPFSGITAEGTWLLALYCTTCTHPAPRVVTALQLAP